MSDASIAPRPVPTWTFKLPEQLKEENSNRIMSARLRSERIGRSSGRSHCGATILHRDVWRTPVLVSSSSIRKTRDAAPSEGYRCRRMTAERNVRAIRLKIRAVSVPKLLATLRHPQQRTAPHPGFTMVTQTTSPPRLLRVLTNAILLPATTEHSPSKPGRFRCKNNDCRHIRNPAAINPHRHFSSQARPESGLYTRFPSTPLATIPSKGSARI